VDPRELPDFAVFRDVDAPWYPEMVVIPAGQFLMGSAPDELERFDWEGPQHRVTIGYRFAIGRYAVTTGEYRRFAEATTRDHTDAIYVWSGSEWKVNASKSWRDPGFTQTDRHPVLGVSWHDAMAFCDWLSKETGKLYRLPSEAEWEYACRAGTATPFFFGETVTPSQVNYDGTSAPRACTGSARSRWAVSRRTHGDCMRCTATSGNGWRTCGRTAIRTRR
jgi:formylglycine-generating enzyme required for sulfatase activity